MRHVDAGQGYAPLASGGGWVVASGVLLVLAGIAALAAPSLTAVTAGVFVGWLLLVVGIAGVAMGARTRRHGRWGDLLYGAASLAAGLFILLDPLAGAVSLTVALAIWFGLRGAIELGGAVRARPGRGRTLLAAIGLVDVALALALTAGVPLPAVQMVGLFLGFGLLMTGVATIAAGMQMRLLTET